jgi:predicted DCC family thiol-disulfide oxidoreductase YuxK
MARPSSLLIAYDAECRPCCQLVDWIRARDRWGLVVFFPLQNPELVKLAPELAGRALHGEVHGMDLGQRAIWSGPALLPQVLGRLPGWRWLAPLLRLPFLRQLVARAWARRVDQRRTRQGRQPFQDRF